MASHELRIGLGTKYIGNTRVEVREVKKFNQPTLSQKNPSEVSMHEAFHVVALKDRGKHVKRVTIERGPGYDGLTEAEFDPVGAVAAHANGCDGTSHDIFITELQGHNPQSLLPVALEITNRRRPDVEAIADALDKKKTLRTHDIDNVISEVKKRKQENKKHTADVLITNTNGGQKEINNVDVSGGTVMVAGEWVSLTVQDKPNPTKEQDDNTGSMVSDEPEEYLPWAWASKFGKKPVAA